MLYRSTVFTLVTISIACLTSLASPNHYQPVRQSRDQQVSVGEWFSFLPQGAPFSVTLPAMPTEKTKYIESGITIRSYELKTGASEYCVVWMYDLPGERTQTTSLDFLFPLALDDILKSARQAGKKDLITTHEKDIRLQRHSGRESVMESASDKIEAKGYIVGHDFVALAVMHPKDQEASGEARRFFDSFTFGHWQPDRNRE